MEDQVVNLKDEDEPLLVPNSVADGRERAAKRWITVEPVIALAIMGITTTALIKPLYIKHKIMASYNETNFDNSTACRSANNSVDDNIDKIIQEESARWLLYISLLVNLPAVVSSAVLSTASDTLGRKFCMVVPIIGFVVQNVMYIITIYFDLPLPVIFVGEIASGLTGGYVLMLAGCIAYIADVTTVQQRTMRIVIAEMVTTLFSGLNLLVEGYLTRLFGFIPALVIAVIAHLLALLYTVVPSLLVETVSIRRDALYCKDIMRVGRSLVQLFKFNENNRRWQMILLNIFVLFSMIETLGQTAIIVLYCSSEPFCWDASTAGLATSVNMLVFSFGMIAGTKLFIACLGDYWLMQIGCLSLFLSYIVTGFAKSTLVIFIAFLVGCFRGIATPIARSALSKITRTHEIGAMFAVIACLESLSTLVSSSSASGVYSATVKFFPPLVFFMFAGCIIPTAALILILQIFLPQSTAYNPGRSNAVRRCSHSEENQKAN